MGIGYAIQGINVQARTKEVLEKLRTNRAEHATIVAEARKGYVEDAKRVLGLRLAQLEEGKIVGLEFRLAPPRDMTAAYDAVISALEMHTGEDVSLSAQQVRTFINDDWDWMEDFLVGNARYSETARAKMKSAGIDPQ